MEEAIPTPLDTEGTILNFSFNQLSRIVLAVMSYPCRGLPTPCAPALEPSEIRGTCGFFPQPASDSDDDDDSPSRRRGRASPVSSSDSESEAARRRSERGVDACEMRAGC